MEMAMLMPWYVFLFVGVFDWGYYSHALVSTEAAVRAAVMYTSKTSANVTNQSTACLYAVKELSTASNVPNTSTCNADPIIVTATSVTGPDNQPAASVTVKYHTLSLIPIPNVLNKQFWIVRTLQMRVQD